MENRKNKTDKRLIIAASAFVLVAAIGAGVYFSAQHDKSNAELATLNDENMVLQEQLEKQQKTIEDMMATFDEIEYNLDIINHKEKLIESQSGDDATLDDNAKESIIKDIQFINTLLTNSQDQIADMQKQLKRSNGKLATFQEKTSKLSEQLATKEEQIQDLKTRLENSEFASTELNEAMDELVAEVKRQKEVIESVDRELHAGYVAMGSYKELKERGIVEKEGGVLWLGRTKTIEENAADQQFYQVDTREMSTLYIDAKKAELITQHPEDSYKFSENDEGEIAALEITDPEKFWKVSDYLVLEVK